MTVRQTDRRMDRPKTICPDLSIRGHKNRDAKYFRIARRCVQTENIFFLSIFIDESQFRYYLNCDSSIKIERKM